MTNEIKDSKASSTNFAYILHIIATVVFCMPFILSLKSCYQINGDTWCVLMSLLSWFPIIFVGIVLIIAANIFAFIGMDRKLIVLFVAFLPFFISCLLLVYGVTIPFAHPILFPIGFWALYFVLLVIFSISRLLSCLKRTRLD